MYFHEENTEKDNSTFNNQSQYYSGNILVSFNAIHGCEVSKIDKTFNKFEHSGNIHNSQVVETFKISTEKLMNKNV